MQSSLAPKNNNSNTDNIDKDNDNNGSSCDVRPPSPEVATSSCSSVDTRIAVEHRDKKRDDCDDFPKVNCDDKHHDCDATSLKRDAFQSSYAISSWSSTSSVATRLVKFF